MSRFESEKENFNSVSAESESGEMEIQCEGGEMEWRERGGLEVAREWKNRGFLRKIDFKNIVLT